MRIAAGTTPGALRREQERKLRLHTGVAGVLVADPAGVTRKARTNLDRLLAEHPRGQARRRLLEWQRILRGPVPEVIEALTSPTERSIELRQNSPFAGVLAPERRQVILEALRNQGSDDAS
jgi:hypothetical protein